MEVKARLTLEYDNGHSVYTTLDKFGAGELSVFSLPNIELADLQEFLANFANDFLEYAHTISQSEGDNNG
jgi:hypothetical protein